MTESTNEKSPDPGWDSARSRLMEDEPSLYELEPGGPLAMDLGTDGWLLEVTPDGRLLCQMGMDMDDMMNLLSDGTPEGLGTDELAKQARYYLQPAVGKFRKTFVKAGFSERTEMTEQYVAVIFEKTMNLESLDEFGRTLQWCRKQFS